MHIIFTPFAAKPIRKHIIFTPFAAKPIRKHVAESANVKTRSCRQCDPERVVVDGEKAVQVGVRFWTTMMMMMTTMTFLKVMRNT